MASFDSWVDGKVSSWTGTLDIEKPPAGPKREPVSPRLKAKLIHPNKNGVLSDIVWSPEGSRIVAADYPGGTVQNWDAKTGQQLVKIETKKPGFQSNLYKLNITADGRTLFAPFHKRNIERLERNGKAITRLRPEGGIRIWDLQTGKLTATLQHTPQRAVTSLMLAPDDRFFVTNDMPGGDFNDSWPSRTSLWIVQSHTSEDLPKDMVGYGAFAPNGDRFAAATAVDMFTSNIKVVSIPSLRELLAIPNPTPFSRTHVTSFSRDGTMIIGYQQSFPAKNKFDTWDYSLKFWNAATGQEITSIPAPEKRMVFWEPVMSPDGQLLATVTLRGTNNQLFLIDVTSGKKRWSVNLADGAAHMAPAFSPDGQWLVVATRVIPKELEDSRDEDPELFPQARIHLIDAATGAVRETLVAPPAFVNKVVFSPDGKTLACDGHGKVLLWNVADIVTTNRK